MSIFLGVKLMGESEYKDRFYSNEERVTIKTERTKLNEYSAKLVSFMLTLGIAFITRETFSNYNEYIIMVLVCFVISFILFMGFGRLLQYLNRVIEVTISGDIIQIKKRFSTEFVEIECVFIMEPFLSKSFMERTMYRLVVLGTDGECRDMHLNDEKVIDILTNLDIDLIDTRVCED